MTDKSVPIHYLDETSMTEFLEQQKRASGNPVTSYAFVTASFDKVLNIFDDTNHWPFIGPACDYVQIQPMLVGVPENYMDVVYDEFYTVNSYQDGVSAKKTENGKKDVISMLYNNDKITTPTSTDPNNVIVRRDGAHVYVGGFLEEIKMLIPTGIQSLIQAGPGDIIRLYD